MSAPESKPLCLPEELLSWRPGCIADDDLLRSTVPLHRVRSTGSRPRLVACHDMRGGYLDDRLVQGSGDADFYTFHAWAAIDVFCYFSHRLVTIPPPGWTNAGHRHGTPVLGTLITEWEAGAEACRQLFASEAAAAQCARQLASIAQWYGFDGWLINVENEVDVSLVPNLTYSLRVLAELMREANPGSLVLWYDAVTTAGKLEWQNSLTPLNRPFWEACDGMLVNYTWKEHTPQEVREAAGPRRSTVYMGVDVFGRGTYGGGRMDCNVALAAARQQGLSAALFATAWPFDCTDEWPGCTSWKQRDELFWTRISAAWGQARPTVLSLPFHSDFSVGSGRALLQQGCMLQSHGWYNLSRQQQQPTLKCAEAAPNSVTASIISSSAFSGGSSVNIRGRLYQPATLRLFDAAVAIPSEGVRVAFTLAGSSQVTAALVLTVRQQSGDTSERRIVCGPDMLLDQEEVGLSVSVQQQHQAPFVLLTGASTSSGSSTSGRSSSEFLASGVDGSHGSWVTYGCTWTPSEFYRLWPDCLNSDHLQLTGVALQLSPNASAADSFEIWLGQVTVQPVGYPDEPSSVTNLSARDVQLQAGPMPGAGSSGASQLSVRLSWQPPRIAVDRCHVWLSGSTADGGDEWQWVGQAHAAGFRVFRWRLAGVTQAVRFAVQSVSITGQAQPLNRATVVEVKLPCSQH